MYGAEITPFFCLNKSRTKWRKAYQMYLALNVTF